MPEPNIRQTTLAEALALVRSGQSLALGGMTLYRRPMAFARALARTDVRDLTLVAFTGGPESDLLIGAGAVSRIRTCYAGFESFGLAPMFSEAVRSGRVEIVEETEATLAYGLKAAAQGVTFAPARTLFGTDIPAVRPDLVTIECPYSRQRYMAIPAVRPDVAVIHVPLADSYGNCVLGGQYAVDRELALAAKRVIITAEAIVPTAVIRAAGADILGLRVSALVHLPWGAHPTSCWPGYPLDGEHLLDYMELAGSGSFPEYAAAVTAGGEDGYRARQISPEMESRRTDRLSAWSSALSTLGGALSPPGQPGSGEARP